MSSFYVLQICHNYKDPFLYLSCQYAALFKDTPYRVVTVYLKGAPSAEVVERSQADEVIFFNLSDKQMRGLKLRAVYRIYQLHRQYQFKFCIGQRHQPLYIATHIPGLKVIGVLHSFDEYNRWGRRLWTLWHQKNLALLGVSNAIRDALRQRLPGFPSHQVQTLYNSVDIAGMQQRFFTREAVRQQFKLGDYFWFVHIGRLVPDKDQTTLIRGFAEISFKLPSARLAIIGAGRLEGELHALVQKLQLTDKVIFWGNVPDAYRYLLAFDAFVLTSTCETFGMVLLEAMAAGLPIVASDLPSTTEVVGNLAWRFPICDQTGLASQLEAVYVLDPKERENCQQAMLKRLQENYSTQSMRKQFWSLPFIQEWGK